MLHRLALALFTAALLVVASGCATIVKGRSTDVTIDSEPQGAAIYLDEEYQGRTPLQVEVDQSCIESDLRVEKEGHELHKSTISTGFSGWVLTPLMGFDLLFGTVCTVDREKMIVKLRPSDDTSPPPTRPDTRPPKESAWPDLAEAAPGAQGKSSDRAVIVAIEDYLLVSDVPGAVANANAWFTWLTKTRGLPYENVTLLKNAKATDVEIRAALKEAAAAAGPDSTVWFVFIGHGAPAKNQRDGVLVGADAQQTVNGLYGRSVPQKEALALLGKGRQANTVVVLDACFSGKNPSGDPIVAGLQPLLPVKQAAPSRGALVLSAGASDEFAGPLPGADRPAFSYLLLGALRGWGDADGDGRVTSDEAWRYTSDTLRATLSGRSQSPQQNGPRDVVLSEEAQEAGPDLGEIIQGM